MQNVVKVAKKEKADVRVNNMESWRNELYHHGVPGQEWGKRNGPPYPLDEKQMSKVERRLNKINKLEDRARKLSSRDESKNTDAVKAQTKTNDRFFKEYKMKKAEKKVIQAQKATLKTIENDQKILEHIRKIESIYSKAGAKLPKEYVKMGKKYADEILAKNTELRDLQSYKIGNSLKNTERTLQNMDYLQTVKFKIGE